MISQFKDMTMFHKLTFERMRKFGKSNSRLSKLICFGINSLFYALKLLAITKQKSNKIFCTVHPSSDQPGIDSFFENRTNLRWSLGLETETSWQTFLRQPLQMDILIIGTPFLRQCYEYRIRNKIQQLQKLGAKVTFVPYNDPEKCYLKVPLAKKIIFYRIPMCPAVDQIYGLAEMLSKEIFWEIDDLVFAPDEYKNHPYLQQCPPSEKEALLFESQRFLQAFYRAPKAICSTSALYKSMQTFGKSEIFLVENVLSDEILLLAEQSLASLREHRNRLLESGIATVCIGYGSGSKSHDHDFASVAIPVQNVLRKHPHSRLVIFGSLNLPIGFEEFKDQILTVGGLEPEAYYRAMSHLDIALAPLPSSPFNDAKSNIKLLEAGIFEIPCLCHPRNSFLSIARHQINAMICENDSEWEHALDVLICQREVRQKLGGQVRIDILNAYTTANNNQLTFLMSN